ncbi:hypothetical protein ACHAW5_009234 [Stephanodiscus triporus]|uniref:G protein gamma domain-containing protein n=1 Tax=Stephanodiscus triporus TaxID=2934178 RepID=A0ABD3PGK4_9STRA
MPKEDKAKTLEEQVKMLKEELQVCREAKTINEACNALTDFAQKQKEPFTTSHPEPNQWHKSAGGGGGGCNIL